MSKKSGQVQSRRTGLSRNTITKYLKEGFQQHAAKGTFKGSLLDDYKPWLQSQFKAGNYNSASLYAKLQEKVYKGGLGILKNYIKEFRPPVVHVPQQRTMRYETSAGKQVQMDWGFVRYINRNGKEKHYLWSEHSVGIDGSVSFEGLKLGVDCSCHSKRVFVAREDNRVMVADKRGMIVGEYLLEGRRKNYFHPNQWTSDYRSYSQKPQNFSSADICANCSRNDSTIILLPPHR